MQRNTTRRNQNEKATLTYSWKNLQIHEEVLIHSRDANRIMLKRFELEHLPFVTVLDGLLELVPADLGRQEPVEEAKRMIGLMKVK